MKTILPLILLTSSFNLLSTSASPKVENLAGFADIDFGLQELATVSASIDSKISIQIDTKVPAQGFRLETSPTLTIHASDSAGATYGLLELTEQLRLYGPTGATPTQQAPDQKERGIKFNIPLDVRTPTYTESSDAAQNAIPHVWERDFWYPFIDKLARDRYNLVSLWNLHPFPSLVKVPEFPDVALDDVRRSTVDWDENYPLQGIGFDRPEIVENYETLKVLSIEEKIAFWQDIMAYAKKRHIKFYFVTWNIFTNGTAGKYGIDNDIHNSTTRDYFRATIRAMYETYPDLAGIGLTTGENMPAATFDEKEDWAYESYGLGTLDAAKADPDRQFTFIHRQHQTGAQDIARKFKPLIDAPNVNFIFSFKYAQAHVMSSVVQPFKDEFVKDIPPQKTLWTLRNDDNFVYRWGGADFTRDFLQEIPKDVSEGVYYGSDQWVWVREFLSTEPESPRQLSLEKQWFHWLLWGRLAYHENLDNKRLSDLVAERFPKIDGHALFQAWNRVAMVYPLTTGFHWGALDFQWYIEGSQSIPGAANTPSGFHDINRFISLPPHPGTNYQSIPDFVAGKKAEGKTPPQIAKEIREHAQFALEQIGSINAYGNKVLRRTLEDIRIQAYLGLHYAHKISAATDLALLRSSWDPSHHKSLSRELNQAAYYWRLYTALATSQYNYPIWTNRVGIVDLAKNFQHVLYDLTICGLEPKIPSADPSPGGTIIEAEYAQSNATAKSELTGFTGEGYVDFQHSEGTRHLTWTYFAPRSGTYVLEFRHSQRWGGASIPADLLVNGQSIPFSLVHSGGKDNWVWDRKIVQLAEGENTISLSPQAAPRIDHLNIIETGY